MTQNLDRFRLKWFGNGFMHDVERLNINDDYALVRPSYADDFTPDEEIKISEGILLQSTSLKDKNGKLIYEGYIVSIEGDTYTIEWSEDNAGFVARCRTPNHPDYDIYGFCDVEMEILGNIHENPEILENPEKINK